MVYLIIILLSVVLSYHYDIIGKRLYRDQWYLFMLVIFILLAGLRWRVGRDTVNYLFNFYHEYPSLDNFSLEEYPLGRDPLYVLLNSVVKSLGGRFYVIQLIHAAFVNTLLFIYIKRHSKYIFTCIFFYAIWFYLGYSMEIMRGSMSIVICLYANDFLLEKNWIKGFLLYFIAFLFHAQTFVIFITPLLFFLRLNRFGLLILGVSIFVGFFIGGLIIEYFGLFELNDAIKGKAIGYSATDSLGASRSITGIVGVVIFVLTALFSLWRLKRNNPFCHLLCLEPCMMLFFIMQFFSIGLVLFYRYVEYYQIYAVFLYAELFVSIAKEKKYGRCLAFFRAFAINILLFIAIYAGYFGSAKTYVKYYPYSTVIDRTQNAEREKYFEQDWWSKAKDYEY